MEERILSIIKEKVKENETPFFIYDSNDIIRRFQLLKDTFLNKFEVIYSMKANTNSVILAKVVEAGYGIEVASEGELKKALAAGMPSDKIIFTGPGKTDGELDFAINANIYAVDIESIQEITRIEKLLKYKDKKVAVSLRINPHVMSKGAKLQMSGSCTQFGIPMNELDIAIHMILVSDYLYLKGFHIYYGSAILQESVLIDNFHNIFSIIEKIINKYKLSISFINFGGGFGEACFENEKSLDMSLLHSEIEKMYLFYRPILGTNVKFLIETGRFVTQNCGYYICQVLRTGERNGSHFAVVDGGIQHISPVVGFGSWLRKNYPLYPMVNNISETVIYEIWGPNNTISDLIEKNVELPLLKQGDYIVIEKVGAYMRTVSPTYFCGRKVATEIVI